MIRPWLQRAPQTFLITWIAAAALQAAGCKSQPKNGPVASPSGSAATAKATACAQYAQKVCEKAGEQSPTCTNFQSSVDLMSEATCAAGIKDINYSIGKLTSLRSSCDTLVKTLCDAVGPKTDTCTLVTTQTKQFPPDRCKQMQEHIPEIVADLKKMEAAKQPLNAELQAKLSAGPVPSFGPETATVKIVEFSDFECPFCSRAASVVHQIREKYGDKVHFAFRQYPLAMHANANVAAQAALAANAQGKFWQFHDELFKNQQALDRASLEKHAKASGLDLGSFKKSLDDKKFAEQVAADMKLGDQASVQGTPTMFINGKRIENPTDFAAIASVIDAELGARPPG